MSDALHPREPDQPDTLPATDGDGSLSGEQDLPLSEEAEVAGGPGQDPGGEGEFDLPYTAAPRPQPPLGRPAPGALRAFLFFTLALALGALVGQTIGLVVGLGLLGDWQLLSRPEALRDSLEQLVAQPIVIFCMGSFSLLLTLAVTLLFTRGWDRRPLVSVGLQLDFAAGRQFLAGLALGAVLMGAVFVIEAALGWLRVMRVLSLPQVLAHAALWLVALLPAAAAEELMLRGYTFQALEEQWGGGAATVLTAVAFGAVHGVNPHAGWASFWGILVSGILFGVAFMVTRRLWLPIGLHAAWNLFEGPVLGFPVSGISFPSAVSTLITGPRLWTGGSFGPEAGLLGILAAVAGAVLLFAAYRKEER